MHAESTPVIMGACFRSRQQLSKSLYPGVYNLASLFVKFAIRTLYISDCSRLVHCYFRSAISQSGRDAQYRLVCRIP